MSSVQEKLRSAPNPQLPLPSFPQLGLFLLLLGWLALAPILVGGLTFLRPNVWPDLVNKFLATILLAGLLLVPFVGFTGLSYPRGWRNLRPFLLALLATALYVTVAATIRVISEAGSNLEIILRLTVLTISALIIGGLGLRQAGVPDWMLSHAIGLDRPPFFGLLLALALIPLVTMGWPITGALGDYWTTQRLLLQTLAMSLPEEIFFRGAVVGLITFNFQHRKAMAALMASFIYVAFTPTLVVPDRDWAKLVLLVTSLPFVLLMVELRARTGSIWSGILFVWAYRAAPLLFTDPRVELPLITQPWQTMAHFWMVMATGSLAVLLWLGRQFLASSWRLSPPLSTGLVLAVALFLWGLWAGLWNGLGFPGFHNDGFLIIMAEQTDLSEAEAIDDLLTRRTFVRDRLIETANRTQAPVREVLEASGLDYRPFYLINMIQVRGHHRQMADFADLPGVARVMLNPNVSPYPSSSFNPGYGDVSDVGHGVGWNIDRVQADEVWKLGITGQGIVVGGQDTGYDWEHPALRNAYRGNEAGSIDHSYSWHDAWSDTVSPFDDDQHGTHTMGTIVGDDGHDNQIGMAPGAQWVGCRNMRRGLGNPASYSDCMEFFLAPYPPGGNPIVDGDVSLAPHIINNSWACPDIEGCDDQVLEPAIDALRAAGIMMVVSAGNSGPDCQTVSEPPAPYGGVFSVGATDSSGRIAAFSSRGPVADTRRLKPDITAPGSHVRSSLPGGNYGNADGTSMAGPHVAGLIALIWSANPDLIGQIEATEEIIRHSARAVEVTAICSSARYSLAEMSFLEQIEALDKPSLCACGNVTGIPNNVYGWGEIDALAAVKMALEWEP